MREARPEAGVWPVRAEAGAAPSVPAGRRVTPPVREAVPVRSSLTNCRPVQRGWECGSGQGGREGRQAYAWHDSRGKQVHVHAGSIFGGQAPALLYNPAQWPGQDPAWLCPPGS